MRLPLVMQGVSKRAFVREKGQFFVPDCRRFNKCSECYHTTLEEENNCPTLRLPLVDNKARMQWPGCILKSYLQTFMSSIAKR
jgi:hypothetical protein